MLVQFGNNRMRKIPRTAKLDEAVRTACSPITYTYYFQNYTQVMNFSVKITFFNHVHVMEGLLLLWLKLKLSFLFTFGNLWL